MEGRYRPIRSNVAHTANWLHKEKQQCSRKTLIVYIKKY